MKYLILGSVVIAAIVWLVAHSEREAVLPPSAGENTSVQVTAPLQKSPSVKVEQAYPAPIPALPAEPPVSTIGSPSHRHVEAPTDQRSRPEMKLEQQPLKGADGKLLKLNQEIAGQACASKGMRLPTIRELANLAKSKGARGIVNAPAGAEPESPEEKIDHVVAIDPDGRREEFFYSSKGFQPDLDRQNIPEDPGTGGFWLQGHWLWSSSRSPNCPLEEPAKFCAYIFDAENGRISDKYNTVQLSAYCVREAR